jgi:hypothetical protein
LDKYYIEKKRKKKNRTTHGQVTWPAIFPPASTAENQEEKREQGKGVKTNNTV